MSLAVGIPRGLLFYEYGPIMIELLRRCGARPVVSPVTNKEIIQAGLELCVDEACLPVKVFFGHVAHLAGKTDVLLVPRFVSIERGAYICPKLMGLPDMIRARVCNAPRLVDPCIDISSGPRQIASELAALGSELGVSPSRAVIALAKSIRSAKRGSPEPAPEPARGNAIRIGVLGHDYSLSDAYISLDLLGKIRRLGAQPIQASDYSHQQTATWERRRAERGAKRLFWTFGRRLVGAAYRWLETGEVDGIVHLASFGCGPESFVAEVIQHEAHEHGDVPLLCVDIDEHSAEAGLLTRLEAFIDTVTMRSGEYAHHLPAPGQSLDTG